MTTTTATPATATARERNEAVWRQSSTALYAKQVQEFLAYWHPDARYEVAYPIDGMPSTLEGQAALAEVFAGFCAAAERIVEEHMQIDLVDGGRYGKRPHHPDHLPRRSHRRDVRVLRRACTRAAPPPPRHHRLRSTPRNDQPATPLGGRRGQPTRLTSEGDDDGAPSLSTGRGSPRGSARPAGERFDPRAGSLLKAVTY
jgi:hypothetical protein